MKLLLFLVAFSIFQLSLQELIAGTYSKRQNRQGQYLDVCSEEFQIHRQSNFYKKLEKDVIIDVQPKILKDGQNATVSWQGIQNPNVGDWIALYCPSQNADNLYLDYIYANESKTWAQGKGQVQFYLGDTRTTCNFRYFLGKSGESTKISTSEDISFVEGIPTNAHLALTGDNTQMRINFVTNIKNVKPLVKWGLNNATLDNIAYGVTTTYSHTDLCHEPANLKQNFVDPGQLHDVLMTNLKPNTRYYYQYGQDGYDLSEVHSFLTAPIVDSNWTGSVIVYGDQGSQQYQMKGAHHTAENVLNEVNNNNVNLVVHTGDLSYARGYAWIWDQWFTMMEPITVQVPYMISVGNHEYDHTSGGEHDPSGAPDNGFHPSWGNFGGDSGGECAVPPFKRFHMPDNGNSIFWYSFNYGSIHFCIFSSEHDTRPGSDQYNFIENDLKNVNRSETPWVILTGHRPMYSSEQYEGDYKVSVGMQAMFEDLLLEYKVDLAFYGHYHSYERMCPLKKGICQPYGEGTTHIVIGNAGYELDEAGLYNVTWSQFFDNKDWGYGKITIKNTTAMLWEYTRNTNQQVTDSVWIYKNKDDFKVTTDLGCTCQQPWEYFGQSYYGCHNPDGYEKYWCYVQEDNCSQKKGTKGFWDTCSQKTVQMTEKGCRCKSPYFYETIKYYECNDIGNDGKKWCYVEGECGQKGDGGYWDNCVVNDKKVQQTAEIM